MTVPRTTLEGVKLRLYGVMLYASYAIDGELQGHLGGHLDVIRSSLTSTQNLQISTWICDIPESMANSAGRARHRLPRYEAAAAALPVQANVIIAVMNCVYDTGTKVPFARGRSTGRPSYLNEKVK